MTPGRARRLLAAALLAALPPAALHAADGLAVDAADPRLADRPDLKARLASSPHAYFRFVNAGFAAGTCAAFEDVRASLPDVSLHGDAHDEGMLYSIARAIVVALGGGGESAVEACTRAVMEAWVNYENFGLYDDVVPCLEQLRRAGLRIALVSNTERDLEHFLTHFALEPLVDAVIASAVIGVLKPALAIFTAAFEALAVHPGEAVMVGDNLDDDVRGGQRSGCGAILLDRDGRHELDVPTIRSLAELPAALGLEPSPAGAKPVSSGTDAGGTSPRRGQ